MIISINACFREPIFSIMRRTKRRNIMKKLTSLIIIFALALSMPVYAGGGEKGACSVATEKASDQAVFHRVSDWFATIGNTPEEKEAYIAKKRAEREAKKAKKMAEKKAKSAQKAANEKAAKMKEKMK